MRTGGIYSIPVETDFYPFKKGGWWMKWIKTSFIIGLLTLLIFLSTMILFVSPSTNANDNVHQIYIHKGACPFECCQFGSWTARQSVDLFGFPNGKIVKRKIKKGEKFIALTGEVHSIPLPVRVTHVYETDEKQGIHVGNIVYVLHGIGEGAVALLHNGKVKDGSLELTHELLNKNGAKFPTCVWWVKILLNDGSEAWIKDPRGFDGMDRCS